LPNTNESATIARFQKFLHLNKALDSQIQDFYRNLAGILQELVYFHKKNKENRKNSSNLKKP
jgi:hypothetical protein